MGSTKLEEEKISMLTKYEIGRYHVLKKIGPMTSWEDLVSSWGWEVEFYRESGDYQGDIIAIVRLLDDAYLNNTYAYGIYQGYYGSCSGCDAYQGCHGDEKQEAKLSLEESKKVKWFNSREDLIEYINYHDWEGDYGGNSMFSALQTWEPLIECKEPKVIDPPDDNIRYDVDHDHLEDNYDDVEDDDY